MNRHIDYVHFNPVKHGYVKKPSEWRHSSIGDYIKKGIYSDDRGVLQPEGLDGEFGE